MKGFTLIELLIVLVIIAILIAVVFGWYTGTNPLGTEDDYSWLFDLWRCDYVG